MSEREFAFISGPRSLVFLNFPLLNCLEALALSRRRPVKLRIAQ